jgi:hypothetical protein
LNSDALIEKLKPQVADPEWPERLLPLFMFRGATKPQRIHTLWNVAYGMYLREAQSLGDGIKTFNSIRTFEREGRPRATWDGHPNDVGHFCGLHAPLQNFSLRSIFERLRGCPQLTDSVGRGFTEYVEWIHPASCILIPVMQVSKYTRTKGLSWWRTPRPLMKRGRKPKIKAPVVKAPAWYMKDAPSFIPKNSRSVDVALMQHIHTIVPKGLPSDLKGDLCQDLLVAVLSGETSISNLPEMMNKYARTARKMMPDRWKTISLDAALPGGDDHTMMDHIGSEHDHF